MVVAPRLGLQDRVENKQHRDLHRRALFVVESPNGNTTLSASTLEALES
jgi:hypothetical protein